MPSNKHPIIAFVITGFTVALLLSGCGKKVPEFKQKPSPLPSAIELTPTSNPNDAFK